MTALREANHVHGLSTVTKVLAELCRAGELANDRDRRGYSLPGANRQQNQQGLFDET